MSLSISAVRHEFVGQAPQKPVSASELRELYNPTFKERCVFLSVSVGIAAVYVSAMAISGFFPLFCALCMPHTLICSITSIIFLTEIFGDTTCTQNNIRKLCNYCNKHHPDEFAKFLRASNFAQIPGVNCGQDSRILESIIGFLNSNVFNDRERTEAANCMHLFERDEYGRMRNIASRTVVNYLISTGATEPIIEWANSIYFHLVRNETLCVAERRASINENATKILHLVSKMPADLAVKILNCEHCENSAASFTMMVASNCTNPETVEWLVAILQKLPQEQRDKVLAKINSYGDNIASCFWRNRRNSTLVNQFLESYPSHEDEYDALTHANNAAVTAAMLLCDNQGSETIKAFLSRLKDFSLEERIEVFSARDNTRQNIFSRLKEHQTDSSVFAAFFDCLTGMSAWQKELCL
ncbi:MAG: hypothetical protein LBI34_03750 [Puniceicoccales bacterium]|jgi:hypothetical protein|nr:hypothetical protein [Puniceicoccales bacterium]